MQTVIYADVLFTVNFFITFLLLSITMKLMKKSTKLYRLLIGSGIGGLSSFFVLADNVSPFVSGGVKLLFACFIVFSACSFNRVLPFLKAVGIFFFSNMIFLGIIIALWLLFKPKGVVINNANVYFDVSAGMLLASALVAYIITLAVVRIINKTTSSKAIYSMQIVVNNQSVKLYALADTGNKLREPFSNYPVIVVNSEKLKKISENLPKRIIPCNTVSQSSCLSAFKPDCVIVSSGKNTVNLTQVYVALSENSLSGDEFSAVINPEILNI